VVVIGLENTFYRCVHASFSLEGLQAVAVKGLRECDPNFFTKSAGSFWILLQFDDQSPYKSAYFLTYFHIQKEYLLVVTISLISENIKLKFKSGRQLFYMNWGLCTTNLLLLLFCFVLFCFGKATERFKSKMRNLSLDFCLFNLSQMDTASIIPSDKHTLSPLAFQESCWRGEWPPLVRLSREQQTSTGPLHGGSGKTRCTLWSPSPHGLWWTEHIHITCTSYLMVSQL